MFQRLLLAWDGSDVALTALNVAIDLTRHYGADLVAASVAYSPVHAETDADRTESSDAAHQYLIQSFSDVADRAHRAGVSVEHTIVDGDTPIDALLTLAHGDAFDLIICGQHSSRRIGHMLLKDIADGLCRRSKIPVLVVPEDDYGRR